MRLRAFGQRLWMVLLGGMLAAPAFSANPVTVVSLGIGNGQGPAMDRVTFFEESWTSTVAFTNVSISAYIASSNGVPINATAYLTTQTGESATSLTEVAQADVALPIVSSPPELLLFSGLTLPPATYYLTVVPHDSFLETTWLNGDLPTPAVTAPGVTFTGPAFQTGNVGDPVYPPDSFFSVPYNDGLAFDVTGVPLTSTGPTGLIIPQVVDGSGWQTTIGVTNTKSVPASAAMQFFQVVSTGGETTVWPLPIVESLSYSDLQLAPGETIYLHTPDTATTLTQGFGELVATPGVVAYAIFTLHVPGRQNQDGTAVAAAPGTEILVPFDNSPGFTTSVAVVNTSEVAETLQAKLILSSGHTVTSSLPIIPGQGHAAFAVSTQFPASSGQSGTLELFTQAENASPPAQGHVAVVDTPTFSVLGLRFNPTGAFTSLPVYVLSAGL